MGHTASLQPRTEPATDLWWEVTDRVTRRQMHPNLWLFLARWVRQEAEGVAVTDVAQEPLPPCEDGAVDGRPKAARATLWEGWRAMGHGGRGICGAARRYTGGYAG
jgi:hypothetical protein